MQKKTLVIAVVVVGFVAITGAPAFSQPAGIMFEVTGTAKLFHFESVPFGSKPPTTSLTAAIMTACITGVGTGCTSSNLELDAGGKLYLILDNLTAARLSTHTNCSQATDLEGLVGGDGSFMLAGKHDKSNTNFILQGKVAFAKSPPAKPFTPSSIKKASVMAVSEDLQHYGIGSFRTVTFFGVCP